MWKGFIAKYIAMCNVSLNIKWEKICNGLEKKTLKEIISISFACCVKENIKDFERSQKVSMIKINWEVFAIFESI